MSDSPYKPTRSRGVVKHWGGAFGFIAIEGGKKDAFAHFSEVQSSGFKQLVQGEAVEFDLEEGPKGLRAVRIVRLGVTA